VLLLLWAAGALVSGLCFVRELGAVGRLARSNSPVDDPDLRECVAKWSARLGLSAPPRLSESGQVGVPTVAGWRKPTLLLPVARPPAGTSLDPVIVHELAHLRRGDLAVLAVARLVRALWWWHPLAWLTARELARSAEEACDDWVIALTEDRRRYADVVVQWAEATQQTAGTLACGSRGRALVGRVRRILTGVGTPSLRLSRWAVGVLVVGATVVMLAAGVVRVIAAPSDPCGVLEALFARAQQQDYDGVWDLMAPEARPPRGEYLKHVRRASAGPKWKIKIIKAPTIIVQGNDTAVVGVTVEVGKPDGTTVTQAMEYQLLRLPAGWRVVDFDTIGPATRPTPYHEAAAVMSMVDAACEAWREQRWEDLYQLVAPSVRPATVDAFVEATKAWAQTQSRVFEVLSVKAPDIPVGIDPLTATHAMVGVHLRCWKGREPGLYDTGMSVSVEKLGDRWYLATPRLGVWPKWVREFRGHPRKKMVPEEQPGPDAPLPDQVVREYLKAWVGKKYGDMFGLLSESARDDSWVRNEATTEAFYCDRLRDLEKYGGQVTAFDRVATESVEKGVAVVTAEVRVNKPNPEDHLGSGGRRFWLTPERGEWRVANEDGIDRRR
jgi:hypothetical protein